MLLTKEWNTYISESYSYAEFKSIIENLLAEGKSTGTNQSEALNEYTKLNLHRMKRIEKTQALAPHLIEIFTSTIQPQHWLIITEGWCGDSAQIVPVIEKIASLNPNIKTHYVFRDENLELMDQYLTNGSRSVPKLIMISADQQAVIGTWGPRPQALVNYIAELKSDNPSLEKEILIEKVHKWYADDRSESIQQEFAELIKSLLN